MLVVVCGNCQSKMRVPPILAGKKGKCSKCGAIVPIPAQSPEPVEPESEPSATVAGSRAVDESTGDPGSISHEESPADMSGLTADASQQPPKSRDELTSAGEQASRQLSETASPALADPPTADEATPSEAATVGVSPPMASESPTQSGASFEPGATPWQYSFLAPPQAADELGRLGGYRVLRVLGQGGMGVVFLAQDIRLGRQVALKAMLPELASKPVARERFLREARTAAAIEHDHIVAIFQVDEDRGVPYIAMPLLKGCSLEEWLRAQQAWPLPVSVILKWGREVAQGLAAAHSHGLIHRDIKPANIFLQSSGKSPSSTGKSAENLAAAVSPPAYETLKSCDYRVKILDFGLARSSAGDSNLTMSGVIMGTPSYMAPEQARSGNKVDARADLFSVGVVLYRLCTRQLPFRGDDTMSTLMSLAMDNPAAPLAFNPGLPPALSELVMRLLQKDPKDRPGSADEVVANIEEIEKSLGSPHWTGSNLFPAAASVAEPREAPIDLPMPVDLPMPKSGIVPPPLPRAFERDDEDEAPQARRPRRVYDDDDAAAEEDMDAVAKQAKLEEQTGLSLASLICGIVSAACAGGGVVCCCVSPITLPVAILSGIAAVALGVFGMQRGGRVYAITGMSLGGGGALVAMLYFLIMMFTNGIGALNQPGMGRF